MTFGQKTPIKTPCVNICVIDTETSECIGCGRTRLEIADWMTMSPDERQLIMSQLSHRVKTLSKRKTRKGGARSRRENRSPVVINFPPAKTESS